MTSCNVVGQNRDFESCRGLKLPVADQQFRYLICDVEVTQTSNVDRIKRVVVFQHFVQLVAEIFKLHVKKNVDRNV